MPAPTASTPIDLVDAADHPIGQIARGKALRAGANFRTCHVFVFDQRGRLLLQQLAEERARFPARWGSSVAAYLFAGERYRDAAKRRMREEIGIDVPLHYVGKKRMLDEHSLKFVGLFTARAGNAQIGDTGQIQALEYWPLSRVRTEVESRPDRFTPTFVRLFSFYRDTLIALGRFV